MKPKTKLKDLKYQAEGIESTRPGLELAVPLIFLFGVLPLGMVLIGLVTMYANRIDDIAPKYQLLLTVLACAYPMYLGIQRVVKKLILNK
jgi:hypothetical protein